MEENTIRARFENLERQVFGCTHEKLINLRIDFDLSDDDIFDISKDIMKFDPNGSAFVKRLRFIQTNRGLTDLQFLKAIERIKAMFQGRYPYNSITEPMRIDFSDNWNKPFTAIIEYFNTIDIQELKIKINDIWESLPEEQKTNFINKLKHD